MDNGKQGQEQKKQVKKTRQMSEAERRQRQAEYDEEHGTSLQDQGMVPDGLTFSIGDY